MDKSKSRTRFADLEVRILNKLSSPPSLLSAVDAHQIVKAMFSPKSVHDISPRLGRGESSIIRKELVNPIYGEGS